MMNPTYVGRFAPSPTGPLHMGSLVAAMASFLDAKAQHGKWLLRIEDTDFDRNVKGADEEIIASLLRCGMQWDGDISWQSQRTAFYEGALLQLAPWVFSCSCSRKEIADSRVLLGQEESQIYPGTCRYETQHDKPARSFRVRVPEAPYAIIEFDDAILGMQEQNIAHEVGDFILKRADGFWAYQLAVVVDDAEQGITHIVRGADLLDSTARQIYLQRLLNYPTPHYMHIPVVTNNKGEKLSKQTGAQAFDTSSNDLLKEALVPASQFLNLTLAYQPQNIEEFWKLAILAWQQKYTKQV